MYNSFSIKKLITEGILGLHKTVRLVSKLEMALPTNLLKGKAFGLKNHKSILLNWELYIHQNLISRNKTREMEKRLGEGVCVYVWEGFT